MAADRELGAEPAVSVAAPVPVMVTLELRVSAVISSVTYSGLPAAPSASRSRLASGLPPARSATRSATAISVSPASSSRAAPPATRRSASRSSRCGTGRIIPTSSSGTCRADLASRPHKVMLAGSAHCRSSMTRTAGRTAHCSATSASNCSASIAGTSVPRSAATSPRSSRTIASRRGFADGSRTRSPSRNGSRGSAWPSSSPAPQNTWQPASGASATAARTSADLPMPGSPSMSTEPPRPRGHLFYQPGQQRHLAVTADQRTSQRHRGQPCRLQAGRSSCRTSWRGRPAVVLLSFFRASGHEGS